MSREIYKDEHMDSAVQILNGRLQQLWFLTVICLVVSGCSVCKVPVSVEYLRAEYKTLASPSDDELNRAAAQGWDVKNSEFVFFSSPGVTNRWVTYYLLMRKKN